MDDEMLTEKTKTAIDKFLNLNGETFREKKTSLNSFVKTLKTEYSYEEVQDFINNLITTTEYDRNLKTEIIVRFQLESSILETLKSDNEASVGKVLKNWGFFKTFFNKMSIDDFVNDFLPMLSYKTSIKLIKILGKNINNQELADNLFNKLEEKCGIKIAMILLCNCSLNLIKDKCSKYGFNLSSRSLFIIYKKYPEFLMYYFDLMRETKHKRISFSDYNQIFNYISKTDLKFFWELNEKYGISFKFGKHRAIKLLPNEEIMLKYGFKNQHLFNRKHILNVARKLNLHKELILKSFPNNLSDYTRNISPYITPHIIYMPKKQVFPLLKELFAKMYNEDFRNYVSFVNGDFLKFVTIEEREFILDRISDKENYLHYYPINRSLPILKEKLKSANDPDTRLKLICSLFNTCNVNNDAKALLETLKFVYSRYKNDTKALHQFMESIITSWIDYSQFTEEHWETIKNLIEYLEYSGIYVNENHIFQNHFVWFVDNNINNQSYKDLLDEYVKKCCKQRWLGTSYYFQTSLKHMKIFINEIQDRLEGKDYHLHFHFLHIVIDFHKQFPNEIDILDYKYILDYGVKYSQNQQTGEEFYFIKNYNQDKSFNKYIKYFDRPYHVDPKIILYCLKNCPEELDNFHSLHKKMSGIDKKIRNFLLCPYFVKKHLDFYNKLSLEQLEDTETEIEKVVLHFFSYDRRFIDVVSNFLPPEDAKIEPKTDTVYVNKQQAIIKYIPQIPTPDNAKLIRVFCKADYLKYALGSLYKIAYKIPQDLLTEFLRDIYQAAVSVKKHALYLGRHLLPVNSYYSFLLAANNLETNLSMRNILLKKTREYFIENVDEKFFNLFIENLQKIDKNDKDLYDYLVNYSNIPREFIASYISIIYDNIMSNEDEDILYKGTYLIENLPDYIMDEISVDLMKRHFQNVDLTTTSFFNKCLFHTTGNKRNEIYEYIINFITNLVKICTFTDIKTRGEITTLIRKISEEACCCNNLEIIDTLHAILTNNIQRHTLITVKILLEFNIIFLKSNKNPDDFAKNIKKHLLETIETYSFNMIAFYAKQLQSFLCYKSDFDKFIFIKNLFNDDKENEVVSLIVIRFLPTTLPTKTNSFVNYLPILEQLKLSDNPKIIAELDLYLQNVS